MSDKEKLKAIFDGRGIGYSEESPYRDAARGRHMNVLYLEVNMSRVDGYSGFWSALNFNEADELTDVEIYE